MAGNENYIVLFGAWENQWKEGKHIVIDPHSADNKNGEKQNKDEKKEVEAGNGKQQ